MSEPYAFLSETHTAVVVGLGDRVHKVKKPVDLGFLDQTTREQRRAACEDEVELNRRFAPDVYLGVGSLQGPEPDDLPEPVVVMRRLPPDRRLAHLARHGAELHDEMRRVAHVVAGYHGVAPTSPTAREAASPEVTQQRWEANAEEMTPFAGRYLDTDTFDAVTRAASRYVAGRRPLLRARVEDGWARDGHGDLLAEDIFCLDDGPRILDCLDFDEHLRVGDVLADAAFLAMDLERIGRPELGWTFLHTHAELLGDTWPRSLAHHHIAYRAQVRAKVNCIRADQGDPDAADAAARLLEIARDHLAEATVRLVLVGGAPGTGKSSLSDAVSEELDAVVLSTDHVRKELAGLSPSDDASAGLDEGIYAPEHTRATYEEVVARARRLLTLGRSVILDASWRDPEHRDLARDAGREAHAPVVELECTAPEELTTERIERRRAAGAGASDADPDIGRANRERAGRWPEATPVDTSVTLTESVDAALATIRATS